MSCWYLGSMDEITPICRLDTSPKIGEINQLINDRYDHFQPDTPLSRDLQSTIPGDWNFSFNGLRLTGTRYLWPNWPPMKFTVSSVRCFFFLSPNQDAIIVAKWRFRSGFPTFKYILKNLNNILNILWLSWWLLASWFGGGVGISKIIGILARSHWLPQRWTRL